MAIDSLCTNARIYFFMIHKIQRLLRHDVSLWWKYLICGKSRYGAEHQKTAWSLQRSEMSSSLEISNIWLRLFTLLHTSEPRVLGIFILILVCALGTRSVQSFVKHIVFTTNHVKWGWGSQHSNDWQSAGKTFSPLRWPPSSEFDGDWTSSNSGWRSCRSWWTSWWTSGRSWWTSGRSRSATPLYTDGSKVGKNHLFPLQPVQPGIRS